MGILCLETPLGRYGVFLRSFLRRKLLFDIVSQKQISCDLCTSLAKHKVKKTVGRFQLEAPTAYWCKQILGLVRKFVGGIVLEM